MAESVSLRQTPRIEWKVRNIFSLDKLESQAFSFNGTRCKFKLVKTGEGEYEYINIILSAIDSLQRASMFSFRCCLFIEDKNRNPHFSVEYNEWVTYLSVWSRPTVDLRAKSELLLTNDVVTLVCVFLSETRENGIEKGVPTQTSVGLETSASLESLSLDMHHLLDSGVLSDVVLKCGDLSVPAHRNILSARSDVFLAMFRSDMTETRTGIIEISDIEPSVLVQLVQYVYAGKVSEMTLDSAGQLYSAADKYAIDALKRLCRNFMMENLAEANACSVLVLAETHKDEVIKDHVLSFIMETELLRDDELWLRFFQEHPKMASDALHLAYKEKCFFKQTLNDPSD